MKYIWFVPSAVKYLVGKEQCLETVLSFKRLIVDFEFTIEQTKK